MFRGFRLYALFFVIIASLAGGYLAWTYISFATSPLDAQSTQKIFLEIERGDLPKRVSDNLVFAGLISSSDRFKQLGSYLKYWNKIQAGEYALSPSMTPLEIFDHLVKGKIFYHSLTIPEGKNMYQIADAVQEKIGIPKSEFISAAKNQKFIKSLKLDLPSGATIEGYLYPDTYRLRRRALATEVIEKMVVQFHAHWKSSNAARAKELGLSPHQVVILASIIEKETGAKSERAMIGSVFHNRLKKRMRLESDPTTIYGIWETYTGNLTKAHLLQKTEFNTYQMHGLPTGPICSPGAEAIEAALYPATSDFLFFVSRNDGTHVFTETFERHKAAVKEFQLNRAAREGKSWRDLGKKEKSN